MNMRFIIVGAGAVGGLLGAMLKKSGEDVAFVARGKARDRLVSAGLHVDAPDGSYDVGPFEADPDPAKLAPADIVFVATKSWQIGALAPGLAPIVRDGGAVVSLLNGVDAADVLTRALGVEKVLGGLCHVLARSSAPAVVTVKGQGLRVTIGELDPKAGSSVRVRAVADALTKAGVGVALPPDVRVAIWSKLLFVGPMGLIGAATSMSVDRYRVVPEARALLAEAMHEVRNVANARGVPVPTETIEETLGFIDALPDGAMTSMHRDLGDGRKSELEEQVGAIVRLGAESNVGTPVHRVLHGLLRARYPEPAS
jgi:2-dehydropantoate 2-reductase